MAAQDRASARSPGCRSPLQAVRAWSPLWPYAPVRPRLVRRACRSLD